MAKRKRLDPPEIAEPPVLETKSAGFVPRTRIPIADVAGEIAGRVALEEVTQAMTDAEKEGRLVRRLPIDRIDRHHVNRDRMALDEDEMESLTASIAERGQQMPIEVMATGRDFALISGLRRLEALRRLGESEVLAFVRRPADAADAHVAMVEENEIRAPLSFYERANVAVSSVASGVFPTPSRAIAVLFSRASSAKRSKIARFVILREKLGRSLSFPQAIPEKLGLRLAQAIDEDSRFASRLSEALRKAAPVDAAAERRVLERSLSTARPAKAGRGAEVLPGVMLETKAGRAVLSGKGVDAAFLADLQAWIDMRRDQ